MPYKLSLLIFPSSSEKHHALILPHLHAEAFERGQEAIGRQIPVVSQNLGMDEAMACISEATGQVVKYEFLPDAEARTLPMSSAAEIANLYQYFRETDHYEVSEFLITPCLTPRNFQQLSTEDTTQHVYSYKFCQ